MNGLKYMVLIMLFLSANGVQAQLKDLFAHPYHPSREKGSIGQFLFEISTRSGITVEYSSNNLDTGKIVTLRGRPSTVGAVLQQVLRGQKISMAEKNGKIILVPATAVLAENNPVQYYSIYGIIKERTSSEPLAQATVWDPLNGKGALTNGYGYFTLLLTEGKHQLKISYTGYSAEDTAIDLHTDTRLDIQLISNSDLEEVVVTSPPRRDAGKKTSEEEYDSLPGETDPMRFFYVVPGVRSSPDMASNMLVRGGGPDQNLFLMDGIPVFNPTHMLGTLSIVSKTSLKSLHLYKSNFPARFGGGLSSVIDADTREGNMQKWKGQADLSLLAGAVAMEGPLKKDKTAIMLSMRHSWVNPFLHILNSGYDIDFYDLHLKASQLIGSRDKLLFSAYAGHDKLYLQKDNVNNQQQWGNKAVGLTWNRIIAPKIFLTTSANASTYMNVGGFRYALYDTLGNLEQSRVYNTFSSVEQYNGSTQVEIAASNVLRFNTGIKASSTSIKPFYTNVSGDFAGNGAPFSSFPALRYNEWVVFYENEINTKRYFIRPGFHVSLFRNGPFHYRSVQPRFYAVYRLNVSNQLSLSYNHMTQYLHQVTNPYLGINSDAWVPSTPVLRPEESNMINLGYNWRKGQKINIGVEAYYRELRHVTNYAEGKNLFLNTEDWEQKIESGKGWVYGAELKAEMKQKRWEAHLYYTLSWNWRKFANINDGRKFPFKYDRRHDINIAASYRYNRHWDFAVLWSFATGDMFTLPNRVYPDFDDAQQINDPLEPRQYRLIYHSSTVNQYRTLPYHRLNVSAGNRHSIGKKIKALLAIGFYNVYGSPDQYIYDLQGTLGKRSMIVATQYDYLSVTPYISYSMMFK